MVISITRPLHCSPLKIQSAYSAPTWKSQTTNLQTETGSCSLGKLQIKYCRPGDHPPARGKCEHHRVHSVSWSLGDFCQFRGTSVKRNSTICVDLPSLLNIRDQQRREEMSRSLLPMLPMLPMLPSVMSVQTTDSPGRTNSFPSQTL